MTASQGTVPATRQKRWSHRTRTGCFTCRQRRVKCDESKPVCNRCVGANRQCEWYNMRTGSISSETDSATTRARSVTPQRSTILRSPPSLEQFNGNESIAELLHLIPMINSMSLAESLEKSVRATAERYLSHLPRRSGRNKALDSAVQCVAIATRKMWVQYSTAQQNSLRDVRHKFLHFDKYDPHILASYAAALSNLQEALVGGKDAVSTETLCAAALLCYLETLLEGSSDDVQNHMFGVIRIIEHRKVSSFHEEFDNCLLLNLVPCIAKACYWTNTDCFLTHKSWRRLIKGAASPLTGRGRTPIDCFLNTSPLINLVVDCSRLIMGQRKLSQPGRDLQHHLLLEKLGKAGDKFFRWSESLFPDIFDSHLQLFMEYGTKDKDGGSRVARERTHEVMSSRILVTLPHHRLYVALGGRDAVHIEKTSQDMAQTVARIHSRQSPDFKRPVALNLAIHTMTDTAEQWLDFSVSVESTSERTLASPEIFGDWMTRMGIKFIHV